jgi:hypothetical protein
MVWFIYRDAKNVLIPTYLVNKSMGNYMKGRRLLEKGEVQGYRTLEELEDQCKVGFA